MYTAISGCERISWAAGDVTGRIVRASMGGWLEVSNRGQHHGLTEDKFKKISCVLLGTGLLSQLLGRPSQGDLKFKASLDYIAVLKSVGHLA